MVDRAWWGCALRERSERFSVAVWCVSMVDYVFLYYFSTWGASSGGSCSPDWHYRTKVQLQCAASSMMSCSVLPSSVIRTDFSLFSWWGNASHQCSYLGELHRRHSGRWGQRKLRFLHIPPGICVSSSRLPVSGTSVRREWIERWNVHLGLDSQ